MSRQSRASSSRVSDSETPGVGADRSETAKSTRAAWRGWAMVIAVTASLALVPGVVLVETETGLLSSVGPSRILILGVLAMVPGVLLGLLSVVTMLGLE